MYVKGAFMGAWEKTDGPVAESKFLWTVLSGAAGDHHRQLRFVFFFLAAGHLPEPDTQLVVAKVS